MSFLGMRGTGDWVANQRPESWDEWILRLFPNGTAPLTAIMSKMGSRSVTDPIFHFWRKTLPTQRVAGTAGAFIYTNAGLSTEYNTTYPLGGAYAVAGATVYVKMSAADVAQLKLGHIILFRDASNYTLDVAGRVTARAVAGASSYVTVTLLEADDNGLPAATISLTTCDVVLIVGTAYGQGTVSADAIAQDVVEDYNYCQIFKDALEITGTARYTKLRTGDAYQEAKRDCLELFSIQREKAYLWGRLYSGTDPVSGKPLYSTRGVIPKITTNKDDFSLNTTYSGQTWLQAGETWLDAYLEQTFRYGSTEKLAFAGSGALLGINQLAKSSGQIQLTPMTVAYGLKVMQWITPFGTIYVKTHPLFSYEASNRNSLLILEPKNLERRVLRDTKFETDIQLPGTDAKKDQFLCEDGLEMQFEETFAYLNGVGLDSTV